MIEAQGGHCSYLQSETEIIFSGGLMMVRDLCSKGLVARLFVGQNLVADLTLKPMHTCKSLGFASLIC